MKTQIENNDFVNDKVVFNTILLPVVFYATGWSFGAVASMIFFTITYFSIPVWYRDDEELYYKYIPVCIGISDIPPITFCRISVKLNTFFHKFWKQIF
jgi:hypothetical protein